MFKRPNISLSKNINSKPTAENKFPIHNPKATSICCKKKTFITQFNVPKIDWWLLICLCSDIFLFPSNPLKSSIDFRHQIPFKILTSITKFFMDKYRGEKCHSLCPLYYFCGFYRIFPENFSHWKWFSDFFSSFSFCNFNLIYQRIIGYNFDFNHSRLSTLSTEKFSTWTEKNQFQVIRL